MARKPPALARELLRNFPKRRGRSNRRRRRSKGSGSAEQPESSVERLEVVESVEVPDEEVAEDAAQPKSPARSRAGRRPQAASRR
jgi:hypothetical protein